jgi:hypothetical protein
MNFVQLCDDLNGLLAKQRKNYEGGVSKGAFNGQVNYFFIKKKKNGVVIILLPKKKTVP